MPSTSQIPTAYQQALRALELTDVTHRVVQISEVPIQQIMLHLAAGELQGLLPAWASEFFSADKKGEGCLTATLRAYANTDMNVLKAAQALNVHPNTIYSRFQKILDITDLNESP